VDAADIMIGIDAIGGSRVLFAKYAAAGAKALIFVEAGDSRESIFVGIKSERVGRTSGFIKTREKASAITFLYPSIYCMLHIKLSIVFCHLTCLLNNSVCLGKAIKGL